MKKTRETKKCLRCGAERFAHQSVLKKGHGNFCSRSCTSLYLWGNKKYKEKQKLSHKGNIPTNLDQLKKIAQSPGGKARMSLVGKKLGGWNKGQIMPQIRGENHYLWIEDRKLLKDDSHDRGGQFHREWSKSVKNRDGWKCKISNSNCSGQVVAHHILPWRDYKELRYEVNNGITLCHFHHPRKRNDEMMLSPFFQELVAIKAN